MKFVTDRTEEDVLLKNEKGRYDYTDLNRVEQDVEELIEIADKAGFTFDLKTKTDWARPDRFSTETWPTESQMQRYLQNVWTLCEEFEAEAGLPSTMQKLTWETANAIEKALKLAHYRIQGMIDTWRYAGELIAGDDGP